MKHEWSNNGVEDFEVCVCGTRRLYKKGKKQVANGSYKIIKIPYYIDKDGVCRDNADKCDRKILKFIQLSLF